MSFNLSVSPHVRPSDHSLRDVAKSVVWRYYAYYTGQVLYGECVSVSQYRNQNIASTWISASLYFTWLFI